MFDIGWAEMALIAVVAIVVIGPKELPKVMREIGIWVSRARAMSRNFMDQLDEMSRQSGIDEVRKEAEALRQLNPMQAIEKTIDPDGVIARQGAELAQIGNRIDAPKATEVDAPKATMETAPETAPLEAAATSPAAAPLPQSDDGVQPNTPATPTPGPSGAAP